jgi:hypothetical protein
MLTGIEDPHHYYADLDFLRIQIRLFILMRVGIWILTTGIQTLYGTILSVHGPPWLHFEPLQLL